MNRKTWSLRFHFTRSHGFESAFVILKKIFSWVFTWQESCIKSTKNHFPPVKTFFFVVKFIFCQKHFISFIYLQSFDILITSGNIFIKTLYNVKIPKWKMRKNEFPRCVLEILTPKYCNLHKFLLYFFSCWSIRIILWKKNSSSSGNAWIILKRKNANLMQK